MHFHIVTLFPDSFGSYINDSIIGRAIKDKKIKVSFYNPRDFTKDLPAPRPGKFFVYAILCDNNAIYIGQTSNIERRWKQHQKGTGADYTKRYKPIDLIHFETFESRAEAVDREKKLKTGFGRKWLKREYKAGRTRQAGKHKRVDQKPYGGGPGMVMEPVSTVKAIQKAVGAKKNVKIVFFAADGKQFDNAKAKSYSKKYKHIVMICGRYEGIDARVRKIFKADPISIGPFILTGGELPAMVVLDAVSRQIEGVLGNFDSVEESRITSSEVYTRPEEFVFKGKKYKVPKVLVSGHHKKIEEWKAKQKGKKG